LRRFPFPSALACVLSLSSVLGCEAPANALDPGQVLGIDHVLGEPGPIPLGQQPGPVPVLGGQPVVGDTCHSDDPQHICLAVKYVVYRDSTGAAIVDQATAINNIRAVNQIWNQCNIGFQIEQYVPVIPADYQLNYRTANFTELDDIRTTFDDDTTLLLVTTGTWDRTGTLGNSGANAWTSMPGGGPYGAVLERPVGTFSNIIGHELGHYMNLLHLSNNLDVMNPIIYTNSTQVNSGQCTTARAAASFFWAKMYR
jgi:hypothetical protein